jgi:hypothetical protein
MRGAGAGFEPIASSEELFRVLPSMSRRIATRQTIATAIVASIHPFKPDEPRYREIEWWESFASDPLVQTQKPPQNQHCG